MSVEASSLGEMASHILPVAGQGAVCVNQRALIDKMLARYATEFGVLRELLQNADDARASQCRIHGTSLPFRRGC